MRKAVLAALGVALLGLAACETPYRDLGILGGVKGARIDEHRATISMKGNLMTNLATAQRYVLRRAAEVTDAAGYSTFKVVGAQGGMFTQVLGVTTTSAIHASRGRSTGLSLMAPFYGSYPDMTVEIYMSNDPVPPGGESHTYDAREVLKYAESAPAAH